MRLEPTNRVFQTIANCLNYTATNLDVFFKILKTLSPYIFLFLFLKSILINYNFHYVGLLISLFYFYLTSCIIITWHRVVINGADNFIAMHPLKPKINEITFIVMEVLILLGSLAIALLPLWLAAITGQHTLVILFFITIPLALYISWKLIFYFPAKATNNTMTLKQSYNLTKGYTFNMFVVIFTTGIIASLLVKQIYLILATIIEAGISILGESQPEFVYIIFEVLINMPLFLFIYPIIAIFNVTLLSNYYQHALQNKPITQD